MTTCTRSQHDGDDYIEDRLRAMYRHVDETHAAAYRHLETYAMLAKGCAVWKMHYSIFVKAGVRATGKMRILKLMYGHLVSNTPMQKLEFSCVRCE